MAGPVDLKKLAQQPCEGEKVLLTGLADGRVMVQSTFRDNEFLIRMLTIALNGAQLLLDGEAKEDAKEARKVARGKKTLSKPTRKKLPPPGAAPEGLG